MADESARGGKPAWTVKPIPEGMPDMELAERHRREVRVGLARWVAVAVMPAMGRAERLTREAHPVSAVSPVEGKLDSAREETLKRAEQLATAVSPARDNGSYPSARCWIRMQS